MANEFKVKNGLIVSGSSWFDEDMFAVNLPEETNPSYYITWRQSDGRFEVSQLSPVSTANTLGCWDWSSGDPGTGRWTAVGDIGSSTTVIGINVTDNGGNNQNSTLASLAVGSVITLYVGSNITSFTITGIKIIYTTPGVPAYYYFNVDYLSGNQYSIVGTPEMCLGVAAAAPANQNCVTYKAVSNYNSIGSTTGGGMFINNTGWSLTVNSNTNYINVNKLDLNNISTKNFFGGITPGGIITLTSGTNTADFIFTYASAGTFNDLLIGVKPIGSPNFTLSSQQSFTICA